MITCLAFLLASSSFRAQAEPPARFEGTLLGIETEPARVMPINGLASFTGNMFVDAALADRSIKIKVTHPDGRIDSFTMRCDSVGNFRYDIGNLREGTYRIRFTSLDERTSVQREFRVEDAARVATVLRKKKILLELSRRLAERAEQRIEQIPEGPDRNQARTRTRSIREETERVRIATNRVFDVSEELASLQNAPREVSGPAMEALSEIAAWADSTDQQEAELRAFEERTRNTATTCDGLDTAAEGLRFMGSITSLVLKPIDTIKKTVIDKLKDEVVERAQQQWNQRNPGAGGAGGGAGGAGGNPNNTDIKFVVNRIKAEVEAFRSGGSDAMLRTIPNQSREVATFVIDKLFSNYCSVIEGPATAEFSVYVPEKGKLFYQYKLQLDATLKLWSEKSKAPTPEGIPFGGKLEGGVKKVDFKANVFAVEKLPKGSKLIAQKIIPAITIGKPNTNVLGSGQVMRTLTPGHFAARYSGLLSERGLKLKQENVMDDFGPLYVNRSMVIAVLPGGILPGVTTFNFKMQKASWIFDRGTKGAFEIPIERNGDSFVAKKEYKRSETVGSGIKVDWVLNYNLTKK